MDGAAKQGDRSVTTTAIAAVCTVFAVGPVFLLGGISALVRAELGFNERWLGLTIGAFFAFAAAGAAGSGRLVERSGAGYGLIFGVTLSGMSLLGISWLATSGTGLMAAMAVAGVANGIIQPAANLALARGVSPGRLGIAFGIKQAAIPIATLSAGISVQLTAAGLGWRSIFGMAAALALPVVLWAARWRREVIADARRGTTEPAAAGPLAAGPAQAEQARAADDTTPPRSARTNVLPLAIAGACGSAAANSLGTFYVESAVAGGHALAVAGSVLTLGSIAGLLARLGGGWFADRTVADLRIVLAGYLWLGAGGYLLLTGSTQVWTLVVGTFVGFAAGWGWPGLLHLAVVRDNMDAPATASGTAQSGIFIGGVVGPIAFGSLVLAHGYATAWSAAAAVTATGGIALWATRRR